MVKFKVDGAGTFEATANGDATCVLPFQNPEMKLFSGAATAILRSGTTAGTLRLRVTASGVKAAELLIPVK
jgi:beta-galactosidase